MALAQSRQDALAARVAGLAAAAQGWLATAQADALARLTAMGLPGKRDEYWRYTDPAALISPAALPADLFDTRDEPPVSTTMPSALLDGINSATRSCERNPTKPKAAPTKAIAAAATIDARTKPRVTAGLGKEA